MLRPQKLLAFVAMVVLLCGGGRLVHADVGGPNYAENALSKDGQLVLRVTGTLDESKKRTWYDATKYAYDSKTDSYQKKGTFRLEAGSGQKMFLSNDGDLVVLSLSETEAVSLYSPEGKLVKSWNLDELITKKQIEACAMTGSTLQWFQEGSFYDRKFYFRGPSQVIRGLDNSISYTVMRGANLDIEFTGQIDAQTGTASEPVDEMDTAEDKQDEEKR